MASSCGFLFRIGTAPVSILLASAFTLTLPVPPSAQAEVFEELDTGAVIVMEAGTGATTPASNRLAERAAPALADGALGGATEPSREGTGSLAREMVTGLPPQFERLMPSHAPAGNVDETQRAPDAELHAFAPAIDANLNHKELAYTGPDTRFYSPVELSRKKQRLRPVASASVLFDVAQAPRMGSNGVAGAAGGTGIAIGFKARSLPGAMSEQQHRMRQLAADVGRSYGNTPAVRRARLSKDEFATLFTAMIHKESNFDPNAVSPVGARGLGQLMPDTARELGVANVFSPDDNLDGSARYLSAMLERFGSAELALAAYNAGPGAVERYSGIPPYRETQQYVADIVAAARVTPAPLRDREAAAIASAR